MHVLKPIQNVRGQGERFDDGKLLLALEAFFKGLALKVLHGDVVQAGATSRMIRFDDARMIEFQSEVGFALEAGQAVGVLGS